MAERFEGPRKVLMPSRFDPIDLDSVALDEGSGPRERAVRHIELMLSVTWSDSP